MTQACAKPAGLVTSLSATLAASEVIGNVLSAERFATARAHAAPLVNRIVGGRDRSLR